jgi:hypothetical protein
MFKTTKLIEVKKITNNGISCLTQATNGTNKSINGNCVQRQHISSSSVNTPSLSLSQLD